MTDRSKPTPPARPAIDPIGRPGGLAHWRQRVLHVLVVVAGWCAFLWFWGLVIGQPYDARRLRLLILGALVAVPVLTLWWVLHNLGIYRRKGPRRSVPRASASYRVDFNGRRIVADWSLLERARHVEIGVAGELKFYRFARARVEPREPGRDPGGRADRAARLAELSE